MALTIKPLSALFLLPPLKSFKFLSPLSRIIASPERWHTFFQDIFSDIQSCPLCAQIMFLIHSSVPYFHHLGMWFLSCFSIPVTPSSRLSFTDSSLSLPELNWVTSVGSWGSLFILYLINGALIFLIPVQEITALFPVCLVYLCLQHWMQCLIHRSHSMNACWMNVRMQKWSNEYSFLYCQWRALWVWHQ